jgi:uncharacterized protein YcgL (UPF0745 family)
MDYTKEHEMHLHNRIAAVAERLWKQAGCPDGMDTHFWLEAEKNVLGYSNDEIKQMMRELGLFLQLRNRLKGSLNGQRTNTKV